MSRSGVPFFTLMLSAVGGWIIEFGLDTSGLAASIKAEMVRYVQPIAEDFPR